MPPPESTQPDPEAHSSSDSTRSADDEDLLFASSAFPERGFGDLSTAYPVDDPRTHGSGSEDPSSVTAGPGQIKSPESLIGMRLGRWHLQSMLGKGGLGAVFHATDGEHEAAVKVILPSRKAARYLPRFRQEAEITRGLEHSGIVGFQGYGEDPIPHLALDLIDGVALDEHLDRRGRLPVEEAVGLLRQLLETLRYAHDQGVLHRDLKPANCLLRSDGRLVVVDFGLGRAEEQQDLRLTHTGQAMGTPHYMAPEQIRDTKHVSAAADLYAVGAVAFDLVTGRPPFAGVQAEVYLGHFKKPVPDLRIWAPRAPEAFVQLVTDLLAKTPEGRPTAATALERLAEVERRLEQRGTPAFAGEALALPEGREVKGWTVTGELGVSDMGKVVSVEREGEQAALKVLLPALTPDKAVLQSFQAAAGAAQDVGHPGIAQLMTAGFVGKSQKRVYTLHELGDTSARELFESRGRLPPREAVGICLGAARALAAAHDKGIAHLRVSPGNVVLEGASHSPESVRVTEFGFSMLATTDAGRAADTALPHCRAPECSRSGEPGPPADVFSLGVILYMLLTGSPPFPERDAVHVQRATAKDVPEPADKRMPGVPYDLARVVDWALLKQPGERPTMTELRDLLADWRQGDLPKPAVQAIDRRIKAAYPTQATP